MHSTECAFGCWYYGSGQVLSKLAAFRKLEVPHLMLHDVYLDLHKLLLVAEKQDSASLFRRVLSCGKKPTEEKALALARAGALFTGLKLVSK